MNKIENDNLTKLIVDVQNGVEGAFEQLYKQTIKFSYSIAYLLLKNEEDIEDALQNSYMHVAKSIKDLKNPESFESWLSVIVKHECQKYIAKRKRVTDIFSAVLKTKDFDFPVEEALTFDLIERKEIGEAVQKIVNNLPDDKRACVALYYFEQNSLPEIAEILGIPEGTVKSRLYNARKTLEKEFKKLQKKDETFYGVSVIPLVAAFLAYQAKNTVVPMAIEKAVLGTVAANGAIAAVGSASATAAASTATGATVTATAGTSVAAGTATAAVTTKIAAIAVAATVATGGTVATVKVVKEHRAPETTTVIVSETLTEEQVTVAALIIEEITIVSDESSTEAASTTKRITSASITTELITMESTERIISSTTELTTLESTESETTSERTGRTTTRRDYSLNNTTKPVTTIQQTTETPTIISTSTTEITTTQPEETTEESTTALADIYDVSNGVLGEYSGNESSVAVPASVDSETVTAIGSGAFAGNTDIESVYIPSGITRIGQEAFADCSNLESVSFPSSLQSIGLGAFCGCTSLTSVVIPSGVTAIGDDAFAGCSSLETVIIPSSVTTIGDNAFGGCDNLVIKCAEGSAAHDYAVENSINYELI